MKLTRIGDFPWDDDFSTHRSLTCINHPTALYSTKNPYHRGIHFLRTANEFPYGTECPCPFSDLAVLCNDDGTAMEYEKVKYWEDMLPDRRLDSATPEERIDPVRLRKMEEK